MPTRRAERAKDRRSAPRSRSTTTRPWKQPPRGRGAAYCHWKPCDGSNIEERQEHQTHCSPRGADKPYWYWGQPRGCAPPERSTGRQENARGQGGPAWGPEPSQPRWQSVPDSASELKHTPPPTPHQDQRKSEAKERMARIGPEDPAHSQADDRQVLIGWSHMQSGEEIR